MREVKADPKRTAVVTGMGVFNSVASDLEEFREALKAGRSGIQKVGFELSDSGPDIYAKLPDFKWAEACDSYSDSDPKLIKLVSRIGRRAPPGIQISLLTALEARVRAGLHRQSPPPEKQALTVGGNNLAANYQYRLYPDFFKNPEYLSPRYALHYMDTDQLGTLSHVFGIKGEGFTVGGASAGGNSALIKALQLIKSGGAELVWVIGALSDLSPMERQGFYNLGAMGPKNFRDLPEEACRPFDMEAEGFIYGQGCGCVILETLESARKRGAEVFAELAGGALLLAGHNLSQPDLDSEVRVMRQALREAGTSPSEIDYINAHGTSSPLGDQIESEAIGEVFSEELSRVWINSTKGLTGHCLSAAGVVEAIAVIIQLTEGFVHPNKNLRRPIKSEPRFCGPTAEKADLKAALSNSFGFGGINSSIILKKGV